MRFFLITLTTVSILTACGGNETGEKTTTATETKKGTTQADPDLDKGMGLIAENDCLTCHKIEEKFTGPSYREVAKRYEDKPEVIDSLAENIITGSVGTWGSFPMTSHPDLSKEDARAMVKYILSLKEQ